MSKVFTIATTEFKRLFHTPIAWSILAVFLFILGITFLMLLEQFISVIQPQVSTLDNPPGVTDLVISPLYLWAGILMLAVMPLLTMRSFAEERMNKTLTLLQSSPLTSTQIVLGKFFGLVFFVLVALLFLTLIPLALSTSTSLDWGKIFSSTLGLFLLLSSFVVAGLFLSLLTQQPIVAAVTTFGLLIFLVVIYLLGSSSNNHSEAFIYISHFGHFINFLDGIIDTRDVVYYLLFIIFFLLLSIRKLDNERI